MKIELKWSDVLVRELNWIYLNCKDMHIDGDSKTVVIEEPNEILIEELEGRRLL